MYLQSSTILQDYFSLLPSNQKINNKMADYFVQHLKNKTFKILGNSQTKEYLEKWSLQSGLIISGWSFNRPFEPHRVKELVASLLLQVYNIEQTSFKFEPTDITLEALHCSITSEEFFDRLLDPANGIVNRSGDGGIRGCFEEVIEDVPVCNELRQMLLNENSDVYPLYSKADRKEFLFSLLLHLAVGGELCQYEDFIKPYIDCAVMLYKSLLSVQKNKETGLVEIRSKCYRIQQKSNCNIRQFIYVLIDAGLREINLFAHF